jgi:carboxypeptidase PM20D1
MIYFLVALAVLLLLAAFVLVRTYLFVQKADSANSLDLPAVEVPEIDLDKEKSAKHLSAAIQIETITHEDPAENVMENFTTLHRLLAKTFPNVHKIMQREVIGEASLLYTWKGKDPSLEPVLLAAHQDVVPIEATSLSQWTYPPFSGKIADGFIWGRGTLDIKSQLVALLEAAEHLIAAGYQPERTVLFGFGCDEEVLGIGAKQIVATLQERGIHLAAMIDEGGCIYDGIIPGLKGLAAAVGVAEKGYLSLKFWVDAEAGHSSTPSKVTSTGVLVHALDRLVAHPFPTKIGMVSNMFAKLAAVASPLMQVAFANLWLLGGVVKKTLLANNETAATIRTTTAVTILKAGVKDNVIPGYAEAIVNFRLLPGESIAQVCDRIRTIVADDRVHFEPLRGTPGKRPPSPRMTAPPICTLPAPSANSSPVLPVPPTTCLEAPMPVTTTPFVAMCTAFSPYVMNPADLNRVHGLNERISVDAFALMIEFFYRFIPRWAQKDL